MNLESIFITCPEKIPIKEKITCDNDSGDSPCRCFILQLHKCRKIKTGMLIRVALLEGNVSGQGEVG